MSACSTILFLVGPSTICWIEVRACPDVIALISIPGCPACEGARKEAQCPRAWLIDTAKSDDHAGAGFSPIRTDFGCHPRASRANVAMLRAARNSTCRLGMAVVKRVGISMCEAFKIVGVNLGMSNVPITRSPIFQAYLGGKKGQRNHGVWARCSMQIHPQL